MTDDLARFAVERGARLIAHEHGSHVFGPTPGGCVYDRAERAQYRVEAGAVIRDVGDQLLQRVSHLRDGWPTGKAGRALFDLVRQEIRAVCDIPVGWRPDPVTEPNPEERT